MSSRREKIGPMNFVLKKVIETPTKAEKIAKLIKSNAVTKMTPQEGLALMVSANLSKKAYQKIRNNAKLFNADMYPLYDEIRKARQECYPKKESITCTESVGQVELESLLHHTTQRLAQVNSVKENIEKMLKESKADRVNGVLTCKWGFDGASGQSEYKQKSKTSEFSNADLFSTTLVPLELSFKGVVVWTNLRASSTRFCRPIRIRYVKETFTVLNDEKKNIDAEISLLRTCTISIKDEHGKHVDLLVTFKLVLSMIDGKAANAITGTLGQQSCSRGLLEAEEAVERSRPK